MKKMKLNIFKFIGFFVMIAFLSSCAQEAFDEYTSVTAAGTPTLTVAIDSNTDSTLTVSYAMNMVGRVTIAVVPAAVDTPTVVDIEARVIDGATYIKYYMYDDANAEVNVTYTDLQPYTSYKVYAIGHNVDGVASVISITDAIRTEDFANPVIESHSPDAEKGVSADVLPTIVFSEPVTYVSGKSIVLTSYFNGYSETIVADSIVISGNSISFKHSAFPFNDYCFLNMDAGAFVDASGNACEASFVSGVVGGYLEGFWFKTGPDPVTVLENIFDNFLGTYTCTDYLNSDSSTVDWGPYSVTITEDENVEYGVIIDNFWAWGVQAKFLFHEDGTITCAEQLLDGIDMGDIYGDSYDGNGIWTKGWAPSQYLPAAGYWDYTDFSFDIALSFINDSFGSIYSDIYQSYVKSDKRELKGQKEPTVRDFPY